MDTSTDIAEDVLLIVNTEWICRLCLRSEGALSDLFDEHIDPKIIENISLFANIHIKPDDNLPLKICHRCRYMIESCCDFKLLILHSNKLLLQTMNSENSISLDKSVEKVFNKTFESEADESKNVTLKKESSSLDDINSSYYEDDIDSKNDVQDDDEDYSEIYSSNLKKRRLETNIKKRKLNDIAEEDRTNINEILHGSNNQLKCLLCLKNCKDTLGLMKHIYMHIKDTDLEPYNLLGESNITCKHCDKKFNYRYNFLDHQRDHLNLKPFPCLQNGCGTTFSSKSLLRQHQAIHAKRNYICATCAVAFKRKSELTAHEKIHEDEGKRYECHICGFLCKTRFTRMTHLKNHKNVRKYKCSQCPKTYFNQSQLRTHELIHFAEKKYSCDQCTSKYYSSSALARHLKVSHSSESSQKNKPKILLFDENPTDVDETNSDLFKLNDTNEIGVNIDNNTDTSEITMKEEYTNDFRDFKRLYAHINNSKKKLIKDDIEKSKECLLCLERFTDLIELSQHIDGHVDGTDLESYYKLGESNINCKCCNKSFNYRYNFLIHQREQLNLKPFRCSFDGCDLLFHSKSALRYHMTIHNDKNFICSVCSMGFKRKTDLTAHEIIHEDADIKYECPICGFVCKTRYTKAAHMKKHQARKTFKCSSCPKEYFCKSHLLTHEIDHVSNTSSKPFPCNECASSYLSRKSLIRHKKEHHDAMDEESEKKNSECPLCKQMHLPIFSKILKQYELDPNFKEYSYRCDECANGFFEEECFNKHIETCFPDSSTVLVEDKAVINTLLPEQNISFDAFQI